MTRLVLVKHSAPTVLASVPAPEWHLSPTGIERCVGLADRLRAFAPRSIDTSAEPKAVETATIVGERLGLPVDVTLDLHEHDRRNTALLGDAPFRQAIHSFFAHPNDVVFGNETAADALARFDAAIGRLLVSHETHEDVVVVSHGTVISLFVEAHTGQDGFDLWSRLGLPSLVILRRADLSLEGVEAALS